MQKTIIENTNPEKTEAKSTCGAYIHIPFCNYKCHFCDFVTAVGKDDWQEKYCQVLSFEIDQRLRAMNEKPAVRTIFYGGGTPGVLEPLLLAEIHHALLDKIKLSKDMEISIETTPDAIDLERAKIWRDLGINRLSIGIESFDDHELASVGRKHTSAEAIAAIDIAAQAGFENINCDLMYGLPAQDLTSWKKSLNGFVQLSQQFPSIKHISAYAMELGPDTPLTKMLPASDSIASSISEDEFERQHNHLLDTLAEAGFQQYEISNFSRTGYECQHNLNYWQQGDYLAFGVSAHRYLNSYRSANWRSLNQYLSDCLGEENRDFIDNETRIKEAIMLGLRTTAGIELAKFKQAFDFSLLDKYSNLIAELINVNLLDLQENRLKLTINGQRMSSSIITAFFKILCHT